MSPVEIVADAIDARIAELQERGMDWHSAYFRALIEQHRTAAEHEAAARAILQETDHE